MRFMRLYVAKGERFLVFIRTMELSRFLSNNTKRFPNISIVLMDDTKVKLFLKTFVLWAVFFYKSRYKMNF